MTTIDSRTMSTHNSVAYGSLGPESFAQAMIIDLDERASDSRRHRHEALEQRFVEAEAAIEHARDAARDRMIGSILTSVGTMVQGGITLANTFASTSGDSSSGASGESASAGGGGDASNHTGQVLSAAGALAPSVFAAASAPLGRRASDADAASQEAKLASERASERATEAGQSAEREGSIRDQLTRKLDEMMKSRHQIDDAALGRPR